MAALIWFCKMGLDQLVCMSHESYKHSPGLKAKTPHKYIIQMIVGQGSSKHNRHF